MKKLLFIFLVLTTSSIFAQSTEYIDSINSKYNKIISKYQQMKASEIKTLSSDNYLTRKSIINVKYDTLISKIEKERNSKLAIIQKTNVIKAEKEEIERQKVSAAEYEKAQIKIAKEKQELDEMREKQRKQDELNESDYGVLGNEIKIEFTAWLEKKEFENHSDYETRIKTNSQAEFKSIIQKKLNESKESYKSALSGTLKSYNVDDETFDLKLYAGNNKEVYQNLSIKLKIPKTFAPYLKEKFSTDNPASEGSPLLVHVLEANLIDNNWSPSHILIIFPNGIDYAISYNQGYYDNHFWYNTKIREEGQGKYSLYYDGVNINQFRLKNINTQFGNSRLDEEVFFYDWRANDSKTTPLNFTIESIGIKLPF